MDQNRFDSIARGLASATDRRTATKGLIAALAGVGLARVATTDAAAADAADGDVGIEKCGGKHDKCFRNRDCCDGLKCKGGDPDTGNVGNCKFKNGHGGKGDWCKKDSDCDRGRECRSRRCR